MHIPLIAAPLLLALLGAPTAPPAASPTVPQTCSYSPSGTVYLDIGQVQTFYPDSGSCSGLTVTISPADGTAGFSSGTGCTRTQVTTGSFGLFKVRGCDYGSATVTVSSGSTVIQTIEVVVGLA